MEQYFVDDVAAGVLPAVSHYLLPDMTAAPPLSVSYADVRAMQHYLTRLEHDLCAESGWATRRTVSEVEKLDKWFHMPFAVDATTDDDDDDDDDAEEVSGDEAEVKAATVHEGDDTNNDDELLLSTLLSHSETPTATKASVVPHQPFFSLVVPTVATTRSMSEATSLRGVKADVCAPSHTQSRHRTQSDEEDSAAVTRTSGGPVAVPGALLPITVHDVDGGGSSSAMSSTVFGRRGSLANTLSDISVSTISLTRRPSSVTLAPCATHLAGFTVTAPPGALERSWSSELNVSSLSVSSSDVQSVAEPPHDACTGEASQTKADTTRPINNAAIASSLSSSLSPSPRLSGSYGVSCSIARSSSAATTSSSLPNNNNNSQPPYRTRSTTRSTSSSLTPAQAAASEARGEEACSDNDRNADMTTTLHGKTHIAQRLCFDDSDLSSTSDEAVLVQKKMPLDLVGKLHRTVYIVGCPDDSYEDLAQLLLRRCGAIEAWDMIEDRLTIVFRSVNSVSTALSFHGMSFVDLTRKLVVWRATDPPPAEASTQLSITATGALTTTSRSDGAEAETVSEAERTARRQRRQERRAVLQATLGRDAAALDLANPANYRAKMMELCYRQIKALCTLTAVALDAAQSTLAEKEKQLDVTNALLTSATARAEGATAARRPHHGRTPRGDGNGNGDDNDAAMKRRKHARDE